MNLNDFGAWSCYKFRYFITPVAVDWAQYQTGYARKTLYVFGLRIATCRVDL